MTETTNTPLNTTNAPLETTSTPGEPTVKKSRTLTTYSTNAMLLRAELVVTGHQSDAEIQSAMVAFKYDNAAMQALGQQLTDCRALVATTLQSRGAQRGQTQQVKDAWSAAKDATATFRLVCTETLKDEPGALVALGIASGRSPQALGAFLLYADNLFTNALRASASVKAKLSARGYSDVRLDAEKAKIDALHAANQAQEQAKGTSQDLTPQQKNALLELDSAVMLYRKLARRALKGQPQLLEKLGIKA
jgi:hypothetical protein